MPHTSGERPQASPFTIPENGLPDVQAPMSSLAVPVSVGTFETRVSITRGLALSPLVVIEAYMCQTGSLPFRAWPRQYSVLSRPASPACICTSTFPGSFLLAGTSVCAADHFSLPFFAGRAHLYLTPAPL